MASGDRIYIADKTTLDSVNTKVTALAGKNSIKASELLSKYKLETVQIPVGNTGELFFNVSGSGYLYLAVAGYASSNNNTIAFQIYVDDKLICNKEIANPANSNGTGIIVPDSLVYINGYPLYPTNNSNFNIKNPAFRAPSANLDNTEEVVYLPVPIRFENSVGVVGRIASSSSVAFTCMYILD